MNYSSGIPEFDDEQAFQDYLEERFEASGYTAIQEVSPHGSRYRADMLLMHDRYGRIGLELKYLTGGTDAATAHKQIVDQYAGRKYLGERVEKWAFAPYMPKLREEQLDGESHGYQSGKLEVLEHFFQRYGIGLLNVHESPYARIKWGARQDFMIPAFVIGNETRHSGFSTSARLAQIESRIEERLFDDG